ncbi:hypothetical protein BC936DRAFT_142104 [Jimgerdemannia flammicorona]|uniref:Xylanolytic transcriptional activator regulatory domain-containing protein n=1 Tax=Jimgerdemannia flammicorona TaxID=994334 RepID=A0A433DFI4_9FUNG|nr:hypothetical protein BC936DRAFT_142104 [Jimgerdemannia flammicorona]
MWLGSCNPSVMRYSCPPSGTPTPPPTPPTSSLPQECSADGRHRRSRQPQQGPLLPALQEEEGKFLTPIASLILPYHRCSKTRPRCSRCARSNQDCVYPDAPPSLSDLARQVVVLHETLRALETRFVSMAQGGAADSPSSSSSSFPPSSASANFSEFKNEPSLEPSVSASVTTPIACANCTQAGSAADTCDGVHPCNRCTELGANCFYHPQARSQELALAVGRLNDALDQLNKRTLEFKGKGVSRGSRKGSTGSEISVKEEPIEGEEEEEGHIDSVIPLPQDAKWTLSYTGSGLRIDANVHRLAQLNALLDDFEQLDILDPGPEGEEGEGGGQRNEEGSGSVSHSPKKRVRLDPIPDCDDDDDGAGDGRLDEVPLPRNRRVFGVVPMLDLPHPLAAPPRSRSPPQADALPPQLMDYILNAYFTRTCCFHTPFQEPVGRTDPVGWLSKHWRTPADGSSFAPPPPPPYPVVPNQSKPLQPSLISSFLVSALALYAARTALLAHQKQRQPSPEAVQQSLYRRTHVLMQNACFDGPTDPADTLPLVQALLFYAWHCFDTRRISEFWCVGGLAVRFANMARLEILIRDVNPTLADEARRTWNALVYLDFQTAFFLGRPLVLSEARFVVPPLRSHPADTRREAIFTTCLVPLVSMLRDGIVRGIYGFWAGNAVPYATVLEMDTWLEGWWAGLPKEWKWGAEEDARKQVGPGERAEDDPRETAYIITLNQYYYVAKILLHQQFLGLSSSPAASPAPRDANLSSSSQQDYDEAFEDDDPLLDAAITSLQACLQSAQRITSLLELAVLGRQPGEGPTRGGACASTITELAVAVYLSSSVYARVARAEDDEFGEMAKDGWISNVRVLGEAVKTRVGGGVFEEVVAVLVGKSGEGSK